MKKINTIDQILKHYSSVLIQNNIKSARLDTVIFLESATGLDRSKILSSPEYRLNKHELNVFDTMIKRRLKKYSVAEIVQHKEFYGREFFVNKHVLIPRPETETMIDVLIDIYNQEPGFKNKLKIRILDVGCGSGVLGITAKLELKNVFVELIDIDRKALNVAKINDVLHTTNLYIHKSDLLKKVNGSFDIMLLNLPYVPDKHKPDESILKEPYRALFGGEDGLKLYERFFNEIRHIQKKPLYLILEALKTQSNRLNLMASKSGYLNIANNDLTYLYKLNK